MTPSAPNPERVSSTATGRLRRAALAVAVLVGCVGAANGDTFGSPDFTFRGFGTVGAARLDQDHADMVSDVFLQPNGSGHTRRWDMGLDTKVGGQLDIQFNPRLSAVLQVVSKHRYDNSWTPEIEWANIKYQLSPGLSVRIGRTIAPMFMMSDTANVGYANPWIRGPREIYGMVPITHLDGVDLAWNTNVGPAVNSFQVSYGGNKFKAVDDLGITGKHAWIISDAIEYETLTVRLSYLYVDLKFDSSDLDSLVNGLSGLGNALSMAGFPVAGSRAHALANQYDVRDTPLEIFSVATRFTPGNWLFMGEWAHLTDAAVLPKTNGWYITGGYHVRKMMPYISVAEVNAKTPSESGIPLAGLPPGPLLGGASALNTGLNMALAAGAPSQKSVALGVRWDLLDTAALKFEYQHIRLDDASAGRFGNLQPGFRPGGNADLFSIALDFVF
ncbi:hypothetical protein [Immundisolibacter sp.]|uniref:hypothetical protein n=1 Tax=Immundisolibacter sp. TaxID=1934948 RepID=UPI00356AF127